jgi:phosphopantetheinyl transferase (holo-ACP synthase)
MERRGIQTDRGDVNRQAAANNQERAQLVAEVIDLQAQRQRQDEARKAARREADAARRLAQKEATSKAIRETIEKGARELEAWTAKQAAQPAPRPTPAPAHAQQPPQKPQQAPPTPAQAPRQSRPSEPAPAAPRQPSPDELQAQQERAERERIERLSIDALRREIERVRPQGVALAVLEDEAVKAARETQQALENQIHRSQQLENWARDTAGMWRQAHPLKARAHDAGWFRSEFLMEREGVEAEERRKRLEAQNSLPAAKRKTESLSQEAEKRILVEQAPAMKRVAELQKVLDAKEVRARLVRDFRELAAKRKLPMLGWGDGGKQWEATPAPLRELIENYNRASPQGQADFLGRLVDHVQSHDHVRGLLVQRQEVMRQQQSHGRRPRH